MITLTNLIPNSSFESRAGWSGVNYDTTEAYDGLRSSKLTGTTITTTGQIATPIVGHKYYGRSYIKSQGDIQPADCRFEWYAGDGAGLNFVFAWNQGNFPNWTMQSSIVPVDAVNGSSYIIRNFVVNAVNPCWTDGLMIVDLTAAFGAGNEPDKAWCDTLPYFESTFEVFTGEVFSIDSAAFNPNPANINSPTLLSVLVTEQTKYLIPTWFYANEIYSGEV